MPPLYPSLHEKPCTEMGFICNSSAACPNCCIYFDSIYINAVIMQFFLNVIIHRNDANMMGFRYRFGALQMYHRKYHMAAGKHGTEKNKRELPQLHLQFCPGLTAAEV